MFSGSTPSEVTSRRSNQSAMASGLLPCLRAASMSWPSRSRMLWRLQKPLSQDLVALNSHSMPASLASSSALACTARS